jgi:beta-glucuronidase
LAGFHRGAPGEGHRRYDDVDVDAVTKAKPNALYEYDMDRSPTATLPQGWVGHDPSLRYYQGLMWYERRFDAPALKPGQRAFLRFEAVNYTAKVFLNGKAVGEHEGGFTPFSMEVTDVLRASNNQVTVGVDSTPQADGVPPPVTDWENYGGITRPMRLVITPGTFVDEAWVRLTKDGKIAATVKLDGAQAANQEVHVRVAELGLDVTGKTDAQGMLNASAAAPKDLVRWSPEKPKLYDVVVQTGEDKLTDRVGFRTIETKGSQILLNGKPIFCAASRSTRRSSARTPPAPSPRPGPAPCWPRSRRACTATSCAWPTIRTARSLPAWPTRWACWSGAKSPSTGWSISAIRAP